MNVKFYECVKERNFFKKSHQKMTCEGVNPQPCDNQTTALPSSPSPPLAMIQIFFLLNLHHSQSDLLVPLFVANVHMISNRKTFVLNHAQLGFKPEKFYLSKSD